MTSTYVVYGMTSADTVTTPTGAIEPGQSCVVYSAITGGSIVPTYAVNTSTGVVGAATGGTVVADSNGRIAFAVQDDGSGVGYTPKYLDWGSGTRWVINPNNVFATATASTAIASVGIANTAASAVTTANNAVTTANNAVTIANNAVATIVGAVNPVLSSTQNVPHSSNNGTSSLRYEYRPNLAMTQSGAWLMAHTAGNSITNDGSKVGFIRRSVDQGRTWTVALSANTTNQDFIFTGITTLASGNIVAMGTLDTTAHSNAKAVVTYVSSSDGSSWTQSSTNSTGVFANIIDVGDLAQLANGNLLALWTGSTSWGTLTSTDGGTTWTATTIATTGTLMQTPELVQAQTGQILALSYNNGISLSYSTNNGSTWSALIDSGIGQTGSAAGDVPCAATVTGDLLEVVGINKTNNNIFYSNASMTTMLANLAQTTPAPTNAWNKEFPGYSPDADVPTTGLNYSVIGSVYGQAASGNTFVGIPEMMMMSSGDKLLAYNAGFSAQTDMFLYTRALAKSTSVLNEFNKRTVKPVGVYPIGQYPITYFNTSALSGPSSSGASTTTGNTNILVATASNSTFTNLAMTMLPLIDFAQAGNIYVRATGLAYLPSDSTGGLCTIGFVQGNGTQFGNYQMNLQSPTGTANGDYFDTGWVQIPTSALSNNYQYINRIAIVGSSPTTARPWVLHALSVWMVGMDSQA